MTTRVRVFKARVWHEDRADQFDADHVDDLRCADCKRSIGWVVDVDEYGRTVGDHLGYSYIPIFRGDGRISLLCEDCTPEEVFA